MKRIRFVIPILLLLTGLLSAVALDDYMPPADIVNDEGGTQVITGQLNVSSPIIIRNTIDAVIILEDQAGFVERDVHFAFPIESQILAQITSDPNAYQGEGSIDYRLPLPVTPAGTLVDVDNDGEDDTGVQVYQTAFWDNTIGDPFIRDLEGEGWSGSYSSATIEQDPGHPNYIGLNGGWLVVYAPDDEQGFPSGYGPDEQLFTADDPIVTLPAGYTAVNIDEAPFVFDRSAEIVFNLNESENIPPTDFSDMSYTEAFDALIEEAKEVYAFTELKDVDWDALHEEYRPRFEEAEANEDNNAYILALRDFTWEIPDSHVGFSTPYTNVADLEFSQQTEGGLGLSLIELDDGRIIVNYLTEGGPAMEAGIERGAEVLAIGGQDIQTAIEETVPYSLPFSIEWQERVQQVRYVVRFPQPSDVEITYLNPGADEPATLTLTTVPERDSFAFTSIYRDLDRTAAPVEFDFLDDQGDYGYVKVQSFGGNEEFMVNTWEYFLSTANATGAPGIIIDLRTNTGGSSAIANRLASYFYTGEETIPLYYTESYSRYIDRFFYDERFPAEIDPALSGIKYTGPVMVLVGPGCASACEFFAYYFTARDNVEFVGQYGTGAMAGGWPPLYMPEDVTFQMPVSRPLDIETREIILEGEGIMPSVRVPIDMETALSEGDPVLEEAIAYLDEITTIENVDGGALEPGDEVTGTLAPQTRVRYTFTIPGGEAVNIYVTGEDDLDTVLRIYDSSGENVLTANDDLNEDTLDAGFEALAASDTDFPVVLEVSSIDDMSEGSFTLTVEIAGGDE